MTSTPPSAPSSISSRPAIGSCSSCVSLRGCPRTTSPPSSASGRAPFARRSRGPWVACAPGWPAEREVARERRRAVVPTSGSARTRPDGAAARCGAHRHAPCARRGDLPGPSRPDDSTRPRLFSIVVAACGVAAVTLGLLATTTSFSRTVREAAHDVGLPVDSPALVDREPGGMSWPRRSSAAISLQPQPHWLACEPPSPGSMATSWPRSGLGSTSSSSTPRPCSPHHRRPPRRHDDHDHLDHRAGDQRADRRRGASPARQDDDRHVAAHGRHANRVDDRDRRPRRAWCWRVAGRSGSRRPGRWWWRRRTRPRRWRRLTRRPRRRRWRSEWQRPEQQRSERQR